MPGIKPQDMGRIMNEHRFGELLPESDIVDSKDHMYMSRFDDEKPCLRGVPDLHNFPSIPMGGYVPPDTSTPDNPRSVMRAALSSSTISEDGTGDGSHDSSTRDGDSDEARALSGRVTGLRSVRRCPKRKRSDEFDDLSEEDEGSPGGRNKRVQANRLSAQRSRQRKLQKEADLRAEVEKQDDQIAELKAEQHRLESVKIELERKVQAKEEIRPELERRNACLQANNNNLRDRCSEIMDANPKLSRMAPEVFRWLQHNPDILYRLYPSPMLAQHIRSIAAGEAGSYAPQLAVHSTQHQNAWPGQQVVAGYVQPMSAGFMAQVGPGAVFPESQLPAYSSAQPSGPPHCGSSEAAIALILSD